MLHAKFHRNWTFCSREQDLFKGFTIYGHGVHLCHVTNFLFRLHIKFGFDWPSDFGDVLAL